MRPNWLSRVLLLLLAVRQTPELLAAQLAPIIDPPAEMSLSPASERDELFGPPPTSAGVVSGPLWTDPCSDCGDPGCTGFCAGSACRWGGFRLIGGAEYLLARPTFSEPLAFVQQIRPTVPDSNGVLQTVDRDVSFDFDRVSTVRAFFGFHFDDCCSELRFTYWRLKSDDRVVGTAGTDTNGNDVFFEIWDVAAVLPGEQLTARSEVVGNVFDLDYSRCIPVGDACGCSDGCGPCQPWEFHWSAGIRIAEWTHETSVLSMSPTMTRSNVLMDFTGAGPRVGLDGRRSLRLIPFCSAYASFDTALLLGNWDHVLVRSAQVGPNSSREVFLADQTRIVPVTEIEIGLAWQYGAHFDLSAGWFHQVWWDLGMSEDVPRGDINFFRDDSNIMAWDGLTVRAELTF